jgi:antitoxin HicB
MEPMEERVLRYPVVITPDGDRFMATFPDIPEALTGAATEAEALAEARDALITALDFYFEDCRPVPMPSELVHGQATVGLPADLSARVLLLIEALAR